MELKEAITKLLRWTQGLEDSSLYLEYQKACGFSDAEWDEVIKTLGDYIES